VDFDYKRLIKLEINVGEKEKKMRLIAGSVLLFISLFTASVILLLVGVILVASGYTKMCPINSALHRNTCETE
jgi:cytochrome b subunit of formate dehydrogenase